VQTSAYLLIALCSIPACAQLPRPVVKGHPVTIVQQITETRTLQDGTQITSVSTETYYRNTQGVSRTDLTMPLLRGRQGFSHTAIISNFDTRESIVWTTYDDRLQTGGVSRNPIRDSPPEQVAASKQVQTKMEDLGLSEVDGYPCSRRRFTNTFPANMFGNDQSYKSMQEECSSTDYGVLTMTQDNPVSGKRVTTLVSLTPGEPDASHFQPPADVPETASR
jgi:hypothetical protein